MINLITYFLMRKMGKRFIKKRTVCSFFVLVFSLFLFTNFGCSFLFPEKKESSLADLFYAGQKKLASKKYVEAQEAFEQILEETTDNEMRKRALLHLGDTFSQNEDYEEAKFQYQKFLELYPGHELAVRAQYQLAMCDFLQIKIPERDQTFTLNAISGFKKVINNYHKSPYTEDAKKKMEFAKNKLAEHEFLVGKFYYKQKKYHSAIFRFNYLLEKYPNIDFADEVLFYLGDSYYKQESFNNAKITYNKLISLHPKSKFVKLANEKLKRIK